VPVIGKLISRRRSAGGTVVRRGEEVNVPPSASRSSGECDIKEAGTAHKGRGSTQFGPCDNSFAEDVKYRVG